MGTIYHLTPTDYYNAIQDNVDYQPSEFEVDGFIHCSASEQQLLDAINRYYVQVAGDFLLLSIDEEAVRAEVRYEAGVAEVSAGTQLFPHIYGPLNRDAIQSVRPMPRNPDGTFHW